ncbi:putative serine esterase [Scheffersomyces amazonensis]|uniref:putative serine esterase n=1 Tax=Scheffersomyces amazonensis TaxID=1078765 RepID=UPI00315CADC7
MSNQNQNQNQNHNNSPPASQSAHLFILIHGLWGSPVHMITIEKLIKDLLPTRSAEKIVTLRPQSFRFWKTYDGMHLNSRKIITEILYEIETLKERDNLNVTKVSFVGYSLGGLLARYVIGLLNEMQFFDTIKPIFFSTFATPHVGIEFFADNFFDSTANHVGPYLFGLAGKELFIADSDKLLLEMADPKKVYFQGLQKFEKHTLFANVKNDRTVAFFTSYITEYSPFDEWKGIKIKYIKDLPQTRVGNVYVKPKFVDLTRSRLLDADDLKQFKGNIQEETSMFRTNKILKVLIIILIAIFLIPIWIPLVLCTSLYVSIYSGFKVRVVKFPQVEQHWLKVKDSVYGILPVDPQDAKIGEEHRKLRRSLSRHESFKGDTSQLTRNAMENIMYAEERFTGKTPPVGDEEDDEKEEPIPTDSVVDDANDLNLDDESDNEKKEIHNQAQNDANELVSIFSTKNSNKKLISVDVKTNDQITKSNLSALKIKDYSHFPLFTEKTKLKLDSNKRFIIEQLNSLDWVKIPIYLDCWNAHDNIVSRKGPRTSSKGTATIALWCSILRNHLEENEN